MTDPIGTALEGVTVRARLVPAGAFRTADGSEIAPEVSTTTNSSGQWSLALERQSGISPSNSYYQITEEIPRNQGGHRVWSISVGASNQTLYAALVSPIPTPGTNTYLTQAAADARYIQSPLTYAAPAESRPGDAASGGSGTDVARANHVHDRERISGTAADRAALSGTDLVTGLQFYETDTGFVYVRTASAWEWVHCTDPPRVKLYLTANQTITTGTITPITFGASTEEYDVGGCHSTSSNTNRITVPAGYGGLWAVWFKTHWVAVTDAGNYAAWVDKNVTNGTDRVIAEDATPGGTSPISHSGYVEIELAAADYLSLQVFQNSGSNKDLDYDFGGAGPPARGVLFGARFIRPL